MGHFLRKKGHLLAVVGLFLLSRAILSPFTGHFDISPLTYYWQYADPKLLREDLLRTLFYLHSQPPLFNLYLGIVLKLFPAPASHHAAFAAGQFLTSLAFTVCLFGLMRQISVPKTLALILTVAFVVSPPYLSFENWFFYDFYTATAFCAIALCFSWFVRSGKLVAAGSTLALAAGLCLTISNVHFLWLLALVAAMCLLRRRRWKQVLLIGVLPVVLVVGTYAKNFIIFGHFSLSTWFVSESLAVVTLMQMPDESRKLLSREHVLSNIAAATPWDDSIEPYRGLVKFRKTGIPVLDDPVKSTGTTNRHNLVYLQISDAILSDSLFVLKHYPNFVRPVAPRALTWLTKPSDSCWGTPHFHQLAGYVRWFSLLFLGPRPVQVLQAVALIVPLVYALAIVLRSLRWRTARGFLAAYGFLAVNIIGFNFPMILLGEETNRYRFRTDALSLALVAVLLTHAYRALARRRRVRALLAAGRLPTLAPAFAGVPTGSGFAGAAMPATGAVTVGINHLVDHVSKNGDFLLNLGLPQSAAIPPAEGPLVDEVRRWLDVNGEAIYGTRPWTRVAATTKDGARVRFTSKGDTLYVILLDKPKGSEISIESVRLKPGSTVVLLGDDADQIVASQAGGPLVIQLPVELTDLQTCVFRITPRPGD
jgi:hypothetical protein